MAAVLHDTVEDTETTFDELDTHFGPIIRRIVDECSDDKSLPKIERKRLQIVHAKHSSFEAKLVKLADKLYNLRDLERCAPDKWTPVCFVTFQQIVIKIIISLINVFQERCVEYFNWAKQVVDNLRGTNENLEKSLDEIFERNCS